MTFLRYLVLVSVVGGCATQEAVRYRCAWTFDGHDCYIDCVDLVTRKVYTNRTPGMCR